MLPIDLIKIDRVFVEGLADRPDDRAIVAAVLSLAEELDLTVIAEGVEDERQHTELHELGCRQAQGYLYARPRPAEQLEPRRLPARRSSPRPPRPLRSASSCAGSAGRPPSGRDFGSPRSKFIRMPERDLLVNFERMRREMDELLGDPFAEQRRRVAARPQRGFSPRVDVYYCGEPPQAVVKAELAGVDIDAVASRSPAASW